MRPPERTSGRGVRGVPIGLAAALAAVPSRPAAPPSSDGPRYRVPSKDPVSDETGPPVPQPTWPGPNTETSTPSGPGTSSETGASPAAQAPDPCSLVSRGEAAAILGGAVQTTLGRQGPTCIYEPEGSPVPR